MEKDALLEIVLHDLKEVETLMQSFKGKAELSPAFFKLTRRKMQSIVEEIDMLEELEEMPAESKTTTEAKERISEIMESAKTSVTHEPQPPTEGPSNAATTTETTPGESDKKEAHPTQDQSPAAETPKEDKPSAAPKEPAKEAPKKEEEPARKSPEQPSAEENPPETKTHRPEDPAPGQEAHPSPKKEHQVLGERLNTGKSSYNEQIARKATNGASRRLINKPVSDLRKALGINDRFFFQRELFGGSAGLLNETLDQLNEMNNMEDARNFLLTNFNWNADNESVISFMNFVERRFL